MSRLSDAYLNLFNARIDRLNATDAAITAQLEIVLGRLEKRYGARPGTGSVALPDRPGVKPLYSVRTVVRR